MRPRSHDRWRLSWLPGIALALAIASPGPVSAADAEETSSQPTRIAQAAEDEPGAGAAEEEAPPEAPEEAEAPADAGDEPPAGDVEVLTVRGRAATAIETDIPSSITQFDASTIQALGAQDVSDLAQVTPNVNIVQPGSTQATFFVRGIGLSDFSANAAGAVTIFQDDVALNAPAIQTGQLFDIQEVEILRGPQGTGPFRNASGGAIRAASNLPTGNYGAGLHASVGRYAAKGGKGAVNGLIQDYEGYLEMPVVTDWLSSRFAFRLRDAEPYKRNGCGNAIPFSQRAPRPKGQNEAVLDAADVCGERGAVMWPARTISQIPVGLEDEVDFDDRWAARGFLRLQPPDSDLDFVLNAHGSRLDEDQTYGQVVGTGRVIGIAPFFGGSTGSEAFPGYQEPDQKIEFTHLCPGGGMSCPSDGPTLASFARKLAQGRPLDIKPYRGDYNRDGKTTRDTWGGFLSATAELAELDLFALTSFDGYERFRDQDTDFTPDVLFETVESDEVWQTWNEVHVGGELETTLLQWEVGGYYLHDELDDDATIDLATAGFTPGGGLNQIQRVFSQDTDSFGAWAKFSWDVLDDVTLEGGVRWNWERKEFEIARQVFLFGSPRGDPSVAKQDETWSTPTGNLILNYHFNDRVSAFAKYTRGFKAGHFNALASEEVDRPPADAEYNDAWEAGLAGAWLDRRLSGSVSYFYYRYENYQIFLFRDVAFEPPVLEIINADQAENYGLEIEGRLEPLRGWAPHVIEDLLLTANFGWLHGEFLDFQIRNLLPVGNEVIPITIDFSGDQLINSPEFKVAGSATWTFDLGRFGYLIPRYDFSWTDDVYYGLNEGRGTSTADIQGSPRLPEFAIGQRAYWLHNVRLAYRTPTGNIEVGAFVRNLEDRVYKEFAFDATNFSNLVLNFTGMPRTIGVDLTLTF